MNFAFDAIQGAIFIALLWITYFLFFRSSKFTKQETMWVRAVFSGLTSVVIVYTLFYGALNSLPKNQVRHAYVPPAPQPVEVKKTEDFIVYKDRIGQFDEKIRDERPKADD